MTALDQGHPDMSRPPSSDDPTARPLADVGVLFVHGIGEQPRAETLLRFAEPLVAWVDGRCRTLGGPGATVSETVLAADALPARAHVEVHLADCSRHWLLAESNWAASFPAPLASDVLLWGARFAVRALLAVLGHLARAPMAAMAKLSRFIGGVRSTAEDLIDEETNPLASYAQLGPVLLLVMTLFVIGAYFSAPLASYLLALVSIVLMAFLLIALASVFLAAGIHVPVLKKRLVPIATRLGATVGDSYALIRQPIRHAAMKQQIRADLQWLVDNSRQVVVVAHSQGSVLTTQMLLTESQPEVHTLITVGAAVTLLDPTEESNPVAQWRAIRPGMKWINMWTGWDPVSSGPIVDPGQSRQHRWDMAYGQAPDDANGASDESSHDSPAIPRPVGRSAPPGFFGFDIGAPETPTTDSPPSEPTAQDVPGSDGDEQLTRLGGALDNAGRIAGAAITVVFSLLSRVALMLIPRTPPQEQSSPPGPEEVVVHNRASVIRDHGAYRHNHEQVMARIASSAAAASGLTAWDKPDEGAIKSTPFAKRHVTAVRLLGASRIVNAIAAGVVVAWLAREGVLGGALHWAGSKSLPLGLKLPDWFSHLPSGSVKDVLWVSAIALALFASWHALTAAAWTSWRRAELPRATGQTTVRTRRFVPFVALVAGAVVASAIASNRLLTASHHSGVGASTLMLVLVELAIIGWSWLGFRPRTVAAGPFVNE